MTVCYVKGLRCCEVSLKSAGPLSCTEHFCILQLIVLVHCFHWHHFQQQWEQKEDVFNEKL